MTRSPVAASHSLPQFALRRIERVAHCLLRAAPEQHGNTIVETAVSLPVFFLLVFGMAQYAIVLLTYCNATYACRLASRYASMHSSSSLAPDTVAQIQGLVTSKLFIGTAITPTVSVNYYTPDLSPGSNVVGNVVLVGVTWSQTVKVPFMSPTSFSIGTQNYKVITR